MTNRKTFVSVSLVSVVALVSLMSVFPVASRAAAEMAPPTDPVAKKLVESLDGNWRCKSSVLMPGAKAPSKVNETYACKRTALGKGLACANKVDHVPDIGQIEGTFLFGYDPGSKSVHMFVVNSLDDVHDHKCNFNGSTLECDLYKGTMGGEPITEEIAITSSSATTHEWKVIVTLKDGGKINVASACKKGT